LKNQVPLQINLAGLSTAYAAPPFNNQA